MDHHGIRCQGKDEGPDLEAWIGEVQSMGEVRQATRRGRQARAGTGTRTRTRTLQARMPGAAGRQP